MNNQLKQQCKHNVRLMLTFLNKNKCSIVINVDIKFIITNFWVQAFYFIFV